MSPRRRPLPVRPRVTPVGPWGNWVENIRLDHGWKQREMFDRLNTASKTLGYDKDYDFDRSHIRRWIGGTAPDESKTHEIIALAWNKPIRKVIEMTEAQRTWRYQQRVQAQAASEITVQSVATVPRRSTDIPVYATLPEWVDQAHDSDTTNHGSDVKRRDFILASGALAVSALRGSLFMRPASGEALEQDLELARLNSLVTDAWRLRQTAQYGDLAALLPRLLVSLRIAATQSISELDQRSLVPLTVHAHNAASSLLRRLRADELAAIAADRAVRYAAEIADPLLEASANYRLANVLMSARKIDDAKEVSLAAAAQLEPHIKQSPAHLAMWGGLLLTASVAAARQHSSSQAWDLLGRSRTAAVWLGSDYVDLNTMFGPSHVAIHAVEVATDLGDYRTALEQSPPFDFDTLPSELLERRFTLLINLALAHRQQGDTTTALELLLRASQVAPEEIAVDNKAHDLIRLLLSTAPNRQPELLALAKRVGIDD